MTIENEKQSKIALFFWIILILLLKFFRHHVFLAKMLRLCDIVEICVDTKNVGINCSEVIIYHVKTRKVQAVRSINLNADVDILTSTKLFETLHIHCSI